MIKIPFSSTHLHPVLLYLRMSVNGHCDGQRTKVDQPNSRI